MKSPSPARVELLCVGSELLEGQVNTHEAYLGRRLRQSGLLLSQAATLPDDQAAMTAAIVQALNRCDALLICGGLGPTFDDLTREATAAALGRGMSYRPSLFTEIRAKFSRRRIAVPEENKRQAFVIDDARILANGKGSAPGQWISVHRKGGRSQSIALMPGPYAELSPMFEGRVLPALRRLYANGIHARHFVIHLAGITESAADEKLAGLTRKPVAGVSYTILASGGQIDFHATATAGSPAAAQRRLAGIARRVRKAVGAFAFGEDDTTLESALGLALRRRGWTLAVAESCTGGGLGQRITRAPGSSKYFLGGVIAYDNAVKRPSGRRSPS